MTITVFVGDVTEYLSVAARASDTSATLITDDNYQYPAAAGTYYTSLGELSSLNLCHLLYQADTIIYVKPDKWSDIKLEEHTEELLAKIRHRKHINGFTSFSNYSNFLEVADSRKTDKNQLWVAGCSISHGVGVDIDQRYGALISHKVNMPVSFLTCPGSSLQWAADQILRSDIQPNDTVVWGLTSVTRMPYFHNKKLEHLHYMSYIQNKNINKHVSIDLLLDENRTYHCLTSIFQVINFCKKLNINLILANVVNLEADLYLLNHPSYIDLRNKYDLGTDNKHPGPLTHQYYAEEILKKL